MSTETMQSNLLELLNVLKPIPQDLIDQLNEDAEATIEIWRRRNEDNWLRLRPHDGDDIYNFFQSQYRSPAVYALPPLGDREFSSTKSTTRAQSVYNFKIIKLDGSFGILDEFKRDKFSRRAFSGLWNEAESGSLGTWSREIDIQTYVRATVIDCLKLSGLFKKLEVKQEVMFSISRIMSKHQNRVDVTTLVTDTKQVASVCEVKIPGSSMDSLFSVVDYMVDLRNSFNVRYVFGVLTTYEKWRILWFEDTNEAAQETDQQKYDELCSSAIMTANDCSISSGKVIVYASRVYDHSEVDLVEALVSLLYKQEADLWNRVWDTKCRVVVLSGQYALLMPFCFHIRFISQQPTFCGLSGWNRRPSSMSAALDDREVVEFPHLNRELFDADQKDPMIVAKEALSTMLKCKVKHDDLKWSHVALLPKFSAKLNTVELMPILIDITRTSPLSQQEQDDTPALLNQFESDLKEELDQIIKQLEYNKKFV
ncbi:hypothetical protein MIR68_001041 [Amoeboaphelidium protococcarum]|nr:hypothetical protein MIR68_001041 [Amoeboaphelidium protococcarum]